MLHCWLGLSRSVMRRAVFRQVTRWRPMLGKRGSSSTSPVSADGCWQRSSLPLGGLRGQLGRPGVLGQPAPQLPVQVLAGVGDDPGFGV